MLLTSPFHAAAAPADADDARSLNIEALGDREPDRWQGRHHYLYDDEYRPDAETMGSALPDARACAQQPVRLKRSDGSTMIKRLKRCD